MIRVIGDIIIDEYWYGSATRISPEAPVPIVNLHSKKVSLGGAANVYANIKALTEDVDLYGLIDETYMYLFKNCGYFARVPKMPVKIRVLCDGHYMTRMDSEEMMDNTDIVRILNLCSCEENDLFVLSDYNKGTLAHSANIIEFLKSKGQRIVVDPKQSIEHYQGAWIVKPNRKEFEEYVGPCSSIDDMTKKARLLMRECDISNMIITLSADGVLYVGQEGVKHLPTHAYEVVDVTGAGDTFLAGLVYQIDQGKSIIESLDFANRMAAVAVQRSGTYVVKKEDL